MKDNTINFALCLILIAIGLIINLKLMIAMGISIVLSVVFFMILTSSIDDMTDTEFLAWLENEKTREKLDIMLAVLGTFVLTGTTIIYEFLNRI